MDDLDDAGETWRQDTTAATRTANVCIGIATRGRPDVLKATIDHIGRQTLSPASILIACTAPGDVEGVLQPAGLSVLFEAPGLTRQRNCILRHLPADAEFVVFFDDDFIPCPDWLAHVVEAFDAHPRVGCITGTVIADGIKGPGLSLEDTINAIESDKGHGIDQIEPGYSPYGCNMALRRAAIGSTRFDERLVLYGWLEDRDFGGALVKNGWHLLKIGTARGVHLGIKKGRVAGLKLGYSQLMNPVYLNRKGTVGTSSMFKHVLRNILANFIRAFAPEAYVDRRGRLIGNLIAVLDLLRGRLTPERAQDL